MKTNTKNILIRTFVILFLIAPWFLQNSSSEIEAVKIDKQGSSFYQVNTCEYTIFDILKNNYNNNNIILLPDTYSSIQCNAKINGVDYFNSGIKVYLGTNLNIDFLFQSLIWLFLIFLIPKSYNRKFKYRNELPITIMVFLFCIHLFGERAFYNSFSKSYSNKLDFQNYFLYALLAGIVLVLIIFDDLLKDRFYNLINYFPFLFLFTGAYNTLNLNFFFLILVYIGLRLVFERGVNVKLTFIYLTLGIFYVNNAKNVYMNFDVDKLKGFINTSQSSASLIFWITSFYFLIVGIYAIIDESKEYLNIKLLKFNFLLSGGVLAILSVLSASSPFINFFSYYYLGLTKLGIKNFQSIEGNTWRGIAPSAEALGEYSAFIILFTILMSLYYRIRISKIELLLIILIFFSLLRSNNFAALVSLIAIIAIYFLNDKIQSNKIKILVLVAASVFSLFFYNKYNEYSYEFTSNILLNEAVNASIISDNLPGNQDGFTAADFSNFEVFLEEPKEVTGLSSSLYYALNEYTNDGNIKFLPDSVALVSQISVPINRSEKWGIFLAKYNPSMIEFMIGSGPLQLSNYYLGHNSKYNDGLVLPHSSLLDLQIFFGIFGLLSMLAYILYLLNQNRTDSIYVILLLFLLVNLIKSDSILYFSSFVLFIVSLNFYKFKKNISNEVSYD